MAGMGFVGVPHYTIVPFVQLLAQNSGGEQPFMTNKFCLKAVLDGDIKFRTCSTIAGASLIISLQR